MDLEKLVARRETIVDEMTKALKTRGFDKSLVQRPVALNQERLVALQSRIKAIETFKYNQIEQADRQIAGLTAEVQLLEKDIQNARAMIEPVIKSARKKTATKLPSQSKAGTKKSKGKSKTKVKATAKRPSPSVKRK